MPKQSGLGWTTFSVDDGGGSARAIVNDINTATFGTPVAVIETTGLDKSAFERIAGLADFTCELNMTFNPDSNMGHDVFKTVPAGAIRTVTITHASKSLANETLFTEYSLERGDDGALTTKASGVLANGTVPAWT